MNKFPGSGHAKLVLGLLVSTGIVVWIIFSVNFSDVIRSFQSLRWYYFTLLVGAYLASFVFRAFRWAIMLRPIKRVSFRSSFGLIFIGFMGNNLLPARLGEVMRALSLKGVEKVSGMTGLSSIMMERILDGLILVSLLALGLLLAPDHVRRDVTIQYVIRASLAVFLGALGLVLFAKTQASLVSRMVDRIVPAGRARDVARKLLGSFLQALEFLRFDLSFLLAAVLSIAVWLAEGAMFYFALPALGLPLSLDIALITLCVVNFGLLIPSLPGYVGLFQGGVIIAFSLFHISRETALTYGLVVHFLQYLTATGMGLYFLNRFNLRLSMVKNSVRSGKT